MVAVGPFDEIGRRFPDAEVVGDGHGIVLPGLVNAHTHLSEALLPGLGEQLTLFEWATRIVVPAGRHLTAETARVGAMLKGAELLLSGVTCVSDMFHHTNMGSLASLGVVDGLETMGLRGVVAFGAEDVFDPHPVAAFLDEHQALADRCDAAERVGFRMGVGTLLGQSDKLLAASVRSARERGWAVHTHLAEVREEVVQARLRWGRSAVERSADAGCWRCRCWPPIGAERRPAAAGVGLLLVAVHAYPLGGGGLPVPDGHVAGEVAVSATRLSARR